MIMPLNNQVCGFDQQLESFQTSELSPFLKLLEPIPTFTPSLIS